MTKLSDNDVLQMKQAARGCIGGRLREWPALNRALIAYGIALPPDTHYLALQRICQIIIDQLDPLNDYKWNCSAKGICLCCDHTPPPEPEKPKRDVMEELAPTRLFRVVKEVKIPIQEKPIRRVHWFVTRDAADQHCAEAKAKGQIILSIAHCQLKDAKVNQYGLSDDQ